MSKSSVVTGVVLLAAGGVAFYGQNRANAELRREIAGLRDDVQRISFAAKATLNAPAASPGMAAPLSAAGPVPAEDLAQLRAEIVSLRKSTTVLTQFVQTAQAAQVLAKSSESVATKLIPVADLKNAGRATPEASTETALWAAVAGDVDALAGALTFTASSRAKADAWFAGLSDATKQQYGSPEKVIALMIARDAATLSGMQVIGQKELGPDDVGLRVRIAGSDGKTKDDSFFMHRAADGWKMLLPDTTVEKFARQLAGGR